MKIEAFFPIDGERILLEHSYPLLAALSRLVPAFHDAEAGLSFAPITGERRTGGVLRLARFSNLRIRLPADRIADVLPLVGQTLQIATDYVCVGAPRVLPLIPATLLSARMVTFKGSLEPEEFLSQARKQLGALGIQGQPGIPLVTTGDRAGQPRRRVLRIKGCRIIGFALQVEGLTAEESIHLQEEGLGGRRRIGCGFFVPYRPRES